MSAPTHAEAREILKRFNDGHWNNPGDGPRYSIPARPDHDDDLRLAAYIDHCESSLTSALARESTLREALSIVNSDAHYINADFFLQHGMEGTSQIVHSIRKRCNEALSSNPPPAPSDGVKGLVSALELAEVWLCNAMPLVEETPERPLPLPVIRKALAAFRAGQEGGERV